MSLFIYLISFGLVGCTVAFYSFLVFVWFVKLCDEKTWKLPINSLFSSGVCLLVLPVAYLVTVYLITDPLYSFLLGVWKG